MDEATAAIERRRDQNREAQRRFRERKKQSKNEQNHELSWNRIPDTPSSSNSASRLFVEKLISTKSVPAHEEAMALDIPTGAAAALIAGVTPSTWHEDAINVTAMNSIREPSRSAFLPTSPKLPRSLSSGSYTTSTPSVSTSRSSKSTDSIGTHPLLICNRSQAPTVSSVSLTAMDYDFWPTPGTPLSISSAEGSIDLTTLDKSRCTSALHIAARKGNINILKMLLHRNISCNEQDHDGLTPLMHAVLEGHIEVVRVLLEQGATITNNEPSHPRSSALHLAVTKKREDILRTLLLHCVDKEISTDPYNERGRTPLHEAIETEYESAVVMLLHFGADPQAKIHEA